MAILFHMKVSKQVQGRLRKLYLGLHQPRPGRFGSFSDSQTNTANLLKAVFAEIAWPLYHLTKHRQFSAGLLSAGLPLFSCITGYLLLPC